MTLRERLPIPQGEYAYAFFAGYLGSTLDGKRRLTVTDWNNAIHATETYLEESKSA